MDGKGAGALPQAELMTGGVEVDMGANHQGKLIGRARRVPELKPGKYADGLPLDEVKYLDTTPLAGAPPEITTTGA